MAKDIEIRLPCTHEFEPDALVEVDGVDYLISRWTRHIGGTRHPTSLTLTDAVVDRQRGVIGTMAGDIRELEQKLRNAEEKLSATEPD